LRDLDVFPANFFDNYFQLYTNPEKFNELEKKYKFNYIVLSTSQLLNLQLQLYYQPGYNLVYADPVTAIFLKENKTNERINNDLSVQKLFTWPHRVRDPAWCEFFTLLFNPLFKSDEEDEKQAPIYAGLFYNQMKNYHLAINMLKPKIGLLRKNKTANITLGNIYFNYSQTIKDTYNKQLLLDSARFFINQAEVQK
jgi:hypothetical protein